MIIIHSEQIPYRGFIKNTEPSIKKDVEGEKKNTYTKAIQKREEREEMVYGKLQNLWGCKRMHLKCTGNKTRYCSLWGKVGYRIALGRGTGR